MCEFWEWTDKLAKKMAKPEVWWEGDFRRPPKPLQLVQWWRKESTSGVDPDILVKRFPGIPRAFWTYNNLEYPDDWKHECNSCSSMCAIDPNQDPNHWKPNIHYCDECLMFAPY
jgi:hypothetical protein